MQRILLPVLLLAAGGVAGAGAGALVRDRAARAGRIQEPARKDGPDSARVKAFLGALRQADPMICEMLADQVSNFWNPSGFFAMGFPPDGDRRWERARDSLSRPPPDPAALRRIARALDEPNPCVRRAAAKLLGHGEEAQVVAVIREGLRSGSPRVREAAALAAGHAEPPALADERSEEHTS